MKGKLWDLIKPREATLVEKTPEDVYADVGHESGMTAEDVSSIGGLESQHGKYDKPMQGGSARGLFQFQPDTAEYLEPGSSESLGDMNTQASLMKKYLEKNDTETVEDAFVKHNLGPGRGEKFMGAKDTDLISKVIPARVIRANPGLYDVKTVGEARQKIKEKLSKGKEGSSPKPNLLDMFREK